MLVASVGSSGDAGVKAATRRTDGWEELRYVGRLAATSHWW